MYKYGWVIPIIIAAFILSILMLWRVFYIEVKQKDNWQYGFYDKIPFLVFGSLLFGLSLFCTLILIFNS